MRHKLWSCLRWFLPLRTWYSSPAREMCGRGSCYGAGTSVACLSAASVVRRARSPDSRLWHVRACVRTPRRAEMPTSFPGRTLGIELSGSNSLRARGGSWYATDAGPAGCRESYGGRHVSYCLIVLLPLELITRVTHNPLADVGALGRSQTPASPRQKHPIPMARFVFTLLMLVATLASAAPVNVTTQSCAYAQLSDYNGGDLQSPGGTATAPGGTAIYGLFGIGSAQDCCAECIAVNGCGAFTYKPDADDMPGKCYLKGRTGWTVMTSQSSTAGVVVGR
jgi:hypothetical protein